MCIIFHMSYECAAFPSRAAFCNWSETAPRHDGMGRGSTFGRAGREVKGQASSVVVINTVVTSGKWSICLMCHFQSGTLVILQTWQPHRVYRPFWNLIRAKTVYQCLAPDIYWKWPFVKVIAKAWKGFVMRPWSFSIVWATKTEPGVLIAQYISYISWGNRQPQRTQLSNT